MTGQTIRLTYTAPYWYIEQELERRTAQHTSSLFSTPDLVEQGWEVRGIYNNFYTAILETLQLAVEEETQIESLDLGWVNPQAPLITTLRTSLTSLTL